LSLKFKCAPSVKPCGCFLFHKEKCKQGLLGTEGIAERFANKLFEETEIMASKLRTSEAMIGAQSQMSRLRVLKGFTTECINCRLHLTYIAQAPEQVLTALRRNMQWLHVR
jgi:hypothetical protein